MKLVNSLPSNSTRIWSKERQSRKLSKLPKKMFRLHLRILCKLAVVIMNTQLIAGGLKYTKKIPRKLIRCMQAIAHVEHFIIIFAKFTINLMNIENELNNKTKKNRNNKRNKRKRKLGKIQ